MTCEHLEFESSVEVGRLTNEEGTEVIGYAADLRIRCVACKMPFCFRGMPFGVSSMNPTMSIDATEARIPIHPEDDPMSGIGLVGFEVKIGTGMDDAGPGQPGVDTSDPDDHGMKP